MSIYTIDMQGVKDGISSSSMEEVLFISKSWELYDMLSTGFAARSFLQNIMKYINKINIIPQYFNNL